MATAGNVRVGFRMAAAGVVDVDAGNVRNVAGSVVRRRARRTGRGGRRVQGRRVRSVPSRGHTLIDRIQALGLFE